jgi:hypothetical protein
MRPAQLLPRRPPPAIFRWLTPFRHFVAFAAHFAAIVDFRLTLSRRCHFRRHSIA